METVHAGADGRDCSTTPRSELDSRIAAITQKMSRVRYVLEQHNIAAARHSRTLADLRVQLDRARRRR